MTYGFAILVQRFHPVITPFSSPSPHPPSTPTLTLSQGRRIFAYAFTQNPYEGGAFPHNAPIVTLNHTLSFLLHSSPSPSPSTTTLITLSYHSVIYLSEIPTINGVLRDSLALYLNVTTETCYEPWSLMVRFTDLVSKEKFEIDSTQISLDSSLYMVPLRQVPSFEGHTVAVAIRVGGVTGPYSDEISLVPIGKRHHVYVHVSVVCVRTCVSGVCVYVHVSVVCTRTCVSGVCAYMCQWCVYVHVSVVCVRTCVSGVCAYMCQWCVCVHVSVVCVCVHVPVVCVYVHVSVVCVRTCVSGVCVYVHVSVVCVRTCVSGVCTYMCQGCMHTCVSGVCVRTCVRGVCIHVSVVCVYVHVLVVCVYVHVLVVCVHTCVSGACGCVHRITSGLRASVINTVEAYVVSGGEVHCRHQRHYRH